jgi:hypothetical protein
VDYATLVCRIGEHFVVRVPYHTQDMGPVLSGSIYVAVDRKYYGWDFDLVRGEGASRIRLMNSEVLDYLDRLPS